MLSTVISKRILTIGCDYLNTKGGISTVIDSYSHIYRPFIFLPTSQCRGYVSNIIYLLVAIVKFCIRCLQRDIKIIHIHTASNNSFRRKSIFVYIASIFNKKIILHIHGGEFKKFVKKNPNIVSSVISKVDVVVALSTSWKNYFEEMYPDKIVKIMPNIVENARCRVYDKRDDNIVKAVFLGKICEAKGVFDLLETISKNRIFLLGKFKLYIGGNGDTEKLCKYIDNHQLDKLVSFEGWVDNNVKTKLLSNSDVFILPSYIEGVPISILEAMTYKLPIISTHVGGIPEIVTHDKNGYLYSPGDKNSLFECIKKIIEYKEKNKAMGEVSYEKVQPHLPQNVSIMLELMYKQLLNIS